MVTIAILCTLLVILVMVVISYSTHRIIVRDLRHDLANKNFHYAVLVELSKILERENLSHFIIEAQKNIKNEKYN